MVNDVKKIREKLAIESWDKITYDQYKELIKIISNIDKETVKYIFEQIPQLFQMSEDLLKKLLVMLKTWSLKIEELLRNKWMHV